MSALVCPGSPRSGATARARERSPGLVRLVGPTGLVLCALLPACGGSEAPAPGAEADPGGAGRTAAAPAAEPGAGAAAGTESTPSAGPAGAVPAATGPPADAPTPTETAALLRAAVPPVPPPAEPIPADPEEREREREIFDRDLPAQRAQHLRLRQALSLAPDDAALRAELGALLYLADLRSLAERELLEAVRHADSDGMSHLLLGDVYRGRSEHGRAAWHLARAIELLPRDARGYRLAAEIAREVDGDELAARLADAGLAAALDDPELLVLRGTLHQAAGEHEAAAALLRRGLAGDPDHLRGHMALGQALFALGEEEEARREMERHERLVMLHQVGALDRDPPYPEWKRAAVLASHHFAAGRLAEGRRELALSYELAPENADALVVEAGHVHDQEGDEPRTVALLERALASDPESLRAMRALSVLLSTAEDPALRDAERALELAERAVARGGGDDVGGYFALGMACLELGRLPEARKALERVLVLAPGHERATEALERLAAAGG